MGNSLCLWVFYQEKPGFCTAVSLLEGNSLPLTHQKCSSYDVGRLFGAELFDGKTCPALGAGCLEDVGVAISGGETRPSKNTEVWLGCRSAARLTQNTPKPWMVLSLAGLDLPGVGEATSHLQVIEESKNQWIKTGAPSKLSIDRRVLRIRVKWISFQISHGIHVWYIYWHLIGSNDKCT